MHRRRLPIGLGSEPPATRLGIVATLGAVAAGTALVYPLKSVAPVVSLGIVYLPAILFISIVWGLRLGLLASVASAVAFNFFHIPPLHRFTIAEEENWVALAAFAIAAIVSSTVAGLARARAVEAERRREEADRALAELAALTRERDRMQAEAVEAEALRRSDELKTALLRSISHDLRTPLTSIIAGGSALGSATLDRRRARRAERGDRRRGQAPLSPGREPARHVAAGGREGRAAPGAGRPRGGAGRGPRGSGRSGVGSARDRPRPADGRRRRRPARARLREPARERDPLRRRAAGLGRGRGWSAAISSSASSTRGRGYPRASGGGSSSRSSAATRRRQAGSGLGLAIAKGFVEANGGEIAIESLPGQGTSFVVTLPQRRARREHERSAASPRLRRRAADPARPAGDPARRRL